MVGKEGKTKRLLKSKKLDNDRVVVFDSKNLKSWKIYRKLDWFLLYEWEFAFVKEEWNTCFVELKRWRMTYDEGVFLYDG